MKLCMPLGGGNKVDTTMTDVLYVPQLSCNLFSVRSAALKEKVVQFGHTKCWIRDKRGKLVGKGRLHDKMHQLDCIISPAAEQASVAKQYEADLWHQHMGHINKGQLRRVNQAYSRLSTMHGQITDCKLDSVVYAGVCVVTAKVS